VVIGISHEERFKHNGFNKLGQHIAKHTIKKIMNMYGKQNDNVYVVNAFRSFTPILKDENVVLLPRILMKTSTLRHAM